MTLVAAGAAFVDRSGAVLAADRGFLARLGAADGDVDAALRAHAASSPELRALLEGDGPGVVSVPGPDGPVQVERVPASGGALLVVRDPQGDDRPEHALRSQVIGRVVAGVAHDIKNPLNAMSLQLALLGDKLEAAGAASDAAVVHLGALRDQIARVNEVLRRLSEATEPAAPLGYVDLGALLTDVAHLFGYEARRRRIDLAVDAHAGSVRTRRDASRVARLVVGLCGRALALTPDGGRLSGRAEVRGAEAAILLEHGIGDPADDLGYDTEVLAAGAAALGGRFERTRLGEKTERLVLLVPRNDRE
jgi:signal transduction histidine kinase